jgi:hypothetical protein
MKYVIIKTYKGFKLVDVTKGLSVQGAYVVDNDGLIVGDVISTYGDPLEAIDELINLKISSMKQTIIEVIDNGRYY